MRTFLICLLITCSGIFVVDAQSVKYNKLESAKITDAGEVMSTYELSEDQIEIIKTISKDVKADPDYVISHARESGWPEPLNDFSYRIGHPEEIKALNVRIFADLEDCYLLIVPKKENKDSAFKLSGDIFLVFTKKGAEPK